MEEPTYTPTVRRKVAHPEGGPLMTKQSMAAETDINQIMKRWIAHGVPPLSGNRVGTYGDFSRAPDFQTALNMVREAEEQFDQLPAHIRKHCRNDPAEFLAMVYDPDRQAELVKLGLKPEQVPEGAKTENPKPAPQPAPDPTTT